MQLSNKWWQRISRPVWLWKNILEPFIYQWLYAFIWGTVFGLILLSSAFLLLQLLTMITRPFSKGSKPYGVELTNSLTSFQLQHNTVLKMFPESANWAISRNVRQSFVCLSVCTIVQTRFPVNWRLPVKKHIASVGIHLDVFIFFFCRFTFWFVGLCEPAYCV